jgi:hypothetical protein
VFLLAIGKDIRENLAAGFQKLGVMAQRNVPSNSSEATIDLLARAIERHARSGGDHVTSFPALSLHRHEAPTEPISCVYGLGLGVTIQGGKQVMLGDRVLKFDPGHSMLTTIDSPVTAAITA